MGKKLFVIVFLILSTNQILVCANQNRAEDYRQEFESVLKKYYLKIEDDGYNSSDSPYSIWLYSIEDDDENRSRNLQLCVEMEYEIHKVNQKYSNVWLREDYLYDYIENTIDKKYSKDQFETQSQYESRVQKDLWTNFTEVCTQAYGDMEQNLEIEIIPKYYDAETHRYYLFVKESYHMSRYPNDDKNFCIDRYPTACFFTYIDIAPDEARFLTTMKLTNKDIKKISWYVEKALTRSSLVSYWFDYGNCRNIAEFSINLSTGTEVKIRTLGTSNPLSIPFSEFHYNVTALKNRKWSYDDVWRVYNQLDAELQKEVAKYNPQYLSNPYNLNKTSLDIHLNNQYRFNLRALKNEYKNKVQILQRLVDTEIDKLRQQLRRQDINRYIEINEQLDSIGMAVAVAEMKEEYRCYNLTAEELKLAYIDNRKPAAKTCKEKYIHLFKSEDEFNNYYSSNQFEEEVANRQRIETMYKGQMGFIDIHFKEKFKFQGCMSYTGDPFSPLGNAKHVAEFLHKKDIDILPSSYAEKLLDKCFDIDTNMAKEYEKNGIFFTNKKEFFAAYITSNYKNILKEKKKAQTKNKL